MSSPGSWPLYCDPLNVLVVLVQIHLMGFYINMLQFSAFKIDSHITAHTTNYNVWPADWNESMKLFVAEEPFFWAPWGSKESVSQHNSMAFEPCRRVLAQRVRSSDTVLCNQLLQSQGRSRFGNIPFKLLLI